MRTCLTTFVVLLAVGLPSGLCQAADWPHWRGPNYDGSSDETGLPESWSKTDQVAWVADLPGQSAATPVIVGDRIFVSSNPKKGQDLLGLCLEAKTGKILWQEKLGSGKGGKRNTPASCSPVADNKRAYFLYASGDLAAVTNEGKVVWSRNIAKEYGRFRIMWTYASSPLLFEGKLFVPVIHRASSYLLAVDPETGKTIWKQGRPTKAKGESQESYSTPVPYKGNVLVAGGDAVTLHDPASGREAWRFSYGNGKNWRLVPTPVVLGDLIWVGRPQKTPAMVINVSSGRPRQAWTMTGSSAPDVCSAAAYNHLLFVLDGDRKVLTAWNASGKQVGTARLKGDALWASPTAADGRLYCINKRGGITVLSADASLKELAAFDMGEKGTYSSIAVSNGRLFLRTPSRLYCITKGGR